MSQMHRGLKTRQRISLQMFA